MRSTRLRVTSAVLVGGNATDDWPSHRADIGGTIRWSRTTFGMRTEKGTRIAPGIQGRANWQPMSYSPQNDLLYIRGQHTPNIYHRIVAARTVGQSYDGGIASPATPESFGTTTAIDAFTGKIRWQLKTDEPDLSSLLCGGSTVTAGGVLFYGDRKGYLNAVDAATGEGL